MEKTYHDWKRDFQNATNFDAWGQPVEASDMYTRLSKSILSMLSLQGVKVSPQLREKCLTMTKSLDLRARSLKSPEGPEEITLTRMCNLQTELFSVLEEFIRTPGLDLRELESNQPNIIIAKPEDIDEDESDCETKPHNNKGFLLPKPNLKADKTYVTIYVEKLGIKDALVYKNPVITIAVKDANGMDLNKSQCTPVASLLDETHIKFGNAVHIQSALQDLPIGFAIFFEFIHYKAKKKCISTKCFAFLEKDEIKSGPLRAELYKKPADYRRRHLNLLTTKPLYLHLNITVS